MSSYEQKAYAAALRAKSTRTLAAQDQVYLAFLQGAVNLGLTEEALACVLKAPPDAVSAKQFAAETAQYYLSGRLVIHECRAGILATCADALERLAA